MPKKFGKKEVSRSNEEGLIETSTTVYNLDLLKFNWIVIEIYEGVSSKNSLKHQPFRIFVKKWFLVKKNTIKKEGIVLLEQLVKVKMNALFGQSIRKDIDVKYQLKSKKWMKIEWEVRIEEYQKLQNGGFNDKQENDEKMMTKRSPKSRNAVTLRSFFQQGQKHESFSNDKRRIQY